MNRDNPSDNPFNQPLGGNQMPRFAGPATMMRLPSATSAEGLDACFVGVPLDIGTSNRAGARFGPRAIRAESCLLRPYNMATRAAPYDSIQVADIGDVAINTFNLQKSMDIVTEAYDEIIGHGCVPLTMGGDHTIVLPILRAMKKKYGAVGVVHVDAHADVNDTMFGEKIAHGTPFRRAIEEGLIDVTGSRRSACAVPAIQQRISTGRGRTAYESCRPRSAGTSRSRRSWPRCARNWVRARCT